MALDLNQTNVDPSSRVFGPMLDDIQANILKGHGRAYAYHLFVTLQKGKSKEARSWIAQFAKSNIISGTRQLERRAEHKRDGKDGGPVFLLSISAVGYKNLGVPDQVIPGDASFRAGLKKRAGKLSDPNPDTWQEPFNKEVDLLIIVADKNPEKAKALAGAVAKDVGAFATVVLQKGKALHQQTEGKEAINIEHFGYADGVSQPMYLNDEIETQQKNRSWHDAEPLKLVLVKDPGGMTEDSFGSYLVFRKLEQNVKAFKQNEGDILGGPHPLPRVKQADGTNNDDLPGAMVVGRFENSTPTVLASVSNPHILKPEQESNDFDYSTDPKGSKCPFHAHIRIANPRVDVTTQFAHSVRLTRRGIPYDDIQPNGRFNKPDTEDVSVSVDELDKTAEGTTGDVGLLFMCYQANIASQFEFIQETWVNHGDIAGKPVGQDGIIGQGQNAFQKELPEQWDRPSPANKITFGGHVKMKGGEYFFTPSLSCLINLDK